METAAALRRRIELAEELRSVTSTMKSLAAVTVSQYERSTQVLGEYVRAVEFGLQVVLAARPELVPTLPDPDEGGQVLVVVLGSARGLCGPINRYIAAKAADVVAEFAERAEPVVVASGARLARELEGIGLTARDVLDVPGSAEGIGPRVEELLIVIDEWLQDPPTDRAVLVYPRPEAGRQYEPVEVDVLPVSPQRLRGLADRVWPSRVLPVWRGQRAEVFAALTRQLLFVDLHRAYAETQVSIHRARLAAMQGAEDSINERLEELSVRYHRQRQAAITNELLDVVSGYETAVGTGET